MPYELKRNRILPFITGGQLYLFTVAPISRDQWLRYFDGVVHEQELIDGAIVSTNDHMAARLKLLGEALVDVSGYATPGDKPLTEIDGWRDMIPAGHRAAVADKLFDIDNGSVALSGPMVLGTERVALNATYGVESLADKVVIVHTGLVHNFRVPSVEHSRRYSRDRSRSRVTGGRTGKTQFMGAQKTLVELYDELIVSVAGYSVDGAPLTDDANSIKLHMDTLHKQQAAFLLFNPQDEE